MQSVVLADYRFTTLDRLQPVSKPTDCNRRFHPFIATLSDLADDYTVTCDPRRTLGPMLNFRLLQSKRAEQTTAIILHPITVSCLQWPTDLIQCPPTSLDIAKGGGGATARAVNSSMQEQPYA